MSNSFNQNEVWAIFNSMKMLCFPDFQALAEAQKRNLDALTAANKLALEGAQAVARRNTQIMQQAIGEMSLSMRTLAADEGSPQDKALQQADIIKNTYERAAANMQEVMEVIQKSNGEALSILSRRFSEVLEEVMGLVNNEWDLVDHDRSGRTGRLKAFPGEEGNGDGQGAHHAEPRASRSTAKP